jgi:hypothetical protein
MRTQVSRWLAGAALSAAAALLAGASGAGDKAAPWKTILAEDVYKELVRRAVKIIDDNADSKDDEARKQAQVAAVRIAAFTQSAKGDAKQLAAVRQAALKVADAIKDKKDPAEVKKLVAAIASAKAEAGTSAEPVDLHKQLETVLDLMNLYRTKMKDGEGLPPVLQTTVRLKGTQNGIEEKIRYMAMKKLTPAALANEAAELETFGYRMAADAALTANFAGVQKGGTRDWMEFSTTMRDAGVALAEAAKQKDAEGIFKAGTALNSSCAQCHAMFRKSG